jgi:hypothetical protein
MADNLRLNKGVFGSKHKCVCPKCSKLHNMTLLWKGRGIPRKYCPVCLNVVGNRSGGLDDCGSEFHKRAISSGR